MKSVIYLIFLLCSFLNAEESTKLKIQADFLKIDSYLETLNFKNNIIIDSSNFKIKSQSAIYYKKNNSIELFGSPARIVSKNVAKKFSGYSDEIIVKGEDVIILSGEAVLNYDGIEINSKNIEFNTATGEVNSLN
mgnify:CR=1 FL=1